MTRVTNSVWVWHGRRLGLMPRSTTTKLPSQLPHDNLHVTIVRLEVLSTSGVYELCLDFSPGHPFLDRGCRYLSALCCTGFAYNPRALRGKNSKFLDILVYVDRRF